MSECEEEKCCENSIGDDSDNVTNFVQDWMGVISSQSERCRQEHAQQLAEVNARTPEAIYSPEGFDHQYGFFKSDTDGWILRFMRYGPNLPWLPETREEISREEIQAMKKTLGS